MCCYGPIVGTFTKSYLFTFLRTVRKVIGSMSSSGEECSLVWSHITYHVQMLAHTVHIVQTVPYCFLRHKQNHKTHCQIHSLTHRHKQTHTNTQRFSAVMSWFCFWKVIWMACVCVCVGVCVQPAVVHCQLTICRAESEGLMQLFSLV